MTQPGQRRVIYFAPEETPVGPVRQALEADCERLDLVTVATQTAAWEHVQRRDTDGLITDHDPPVVDGLAILRRVRRRQPELPVVVYPSDGDEQLASRAISAGANEYVPRPTTSHQAEQLADRLDSLLDGRHPSAPTRREPERLSYVAEAFPDVAFTISRDGRYLEILTENRNALLYADPEELIGHRFREVLPAATAERFHNAVKQTINTGTIQQLEYTLETTDGQRWFDARVVPVETTTDAIVIWVARDITERKHREREYEQVFHGVHDGITIHDPETAQILDANNTYIDRLGYDSLEAVQNAGINGLSDTEAGYTKERAKRLICGVDTRGEPRTVEWAARTREGERVWLEAALAPAVIGGKQRVITLQRDVTERKRRAREYEQIFNGVNEAISIHDPTTAAIIDVNDTYLDLLGYPDVEAVKDDGIAGISAISEGYTRDRAVTIINRVATTGESETVEWKATTTDGSRIWVEVTATPAEISGEQRVLAIQRDITARKRYEQRLEVFNRVLRHNLRNRVDVIMSHAEVLANTTEGSHVEQIIAAAQALANVGDRARTIDRFFSREISPETLSITAIFDRTIDRLDVPDTDVTVETRIPANLNVTTDGEVLTATLESILENAVTYADRKVIIRGERTDGQCVITVSDDGPGIPDCDRVPLESVSETDLQHGRGLGLWQARWGVERLNGTITFEVGNGTTVRVAIPDR